MSKLIMVGVLVGALLAGFSPAMAGLPQGCSNSPGAGHCPQGGIGDPLTLAASGVVIPFVTSNGAVSLVEVASPVSANPNLHMQFFNASCVKVGPSVGMPLTTNDIAFQPVGLAQGGVVPNGVDGLVAISAVGPDGFTNIPLEAPIHSRMYVFQASDGTSRVLEPIVLDTAEFAGNPHRWSPMRTAATFFSPLQTATVQTRLTLICPQSTIQGASGGYFTSDLFPQISPPFPPIPTPHELRARIYDTNEIFLRNVVPIPCSCLTTLNLVDPTAIDPVYANAAVAANGTYTELEEVPASAGNSATSSFTGYRAIFTVGSPLNNFFGRLSNGSRESIQGTLDNER